MQQRQGKSSMVWWASHVAARSFQHEAGPHCANKRGNGLRPMITTVLVEYTARQTSTSHARNVRGGIKHALHCWMHIACTRARLSARQGAAAICSRVPPLTGRFRAQKLHPRAIARRFLVEHYCFDSIPLNCPHRQAAWGRTEHANGLCRRFRLCGFRVQQQVQGRRHGQTEWALGIHYDFYPCEYSIQ